MAKRSPFPPSLLQSRQEAGRPPATARRGFVLKPLALAVVVVGLPVAAGLPSASAQAADERAAEARRSFDIPAGPLDQALSRLGRQANVQIVVNAALTQGVQSPGVQGYYSVSEGLQRLLAGTGLQAVRDAGGEFTLRPLPQDQADGSLTLPSLAVTGALESATGPVDGYVARRSATATKTNAAIIETPQSISVVTRDQMDVQGAQTVSEALRYTAGVLTGTGGGQTRFDTVFIRGFGGLSNASNFTKYVDGLGWPHIPRTSVQMDPYALERVEVLRGPSSVLYGQADPGGFVNMVSKRPTDQAFGELMVQLANHSGRAIGLDLGGPLDEGGALSYRLTGLARDSQTGVDYQKDERQFIAPSVRWALSEDTSLTLQAFYQHDPEQPDTSFVPPAFAGVGPVRSPYGKLPIDYFQGDPNWNRFTRTMKTVGWEFEHAFDEVWSFRQKVRYGEFESDTRQLNNGTPAPNFMTLPRTASRNTADVQTLAADNQLQAQFDTGAIEHTVLVGADWRDSDFLAKAGSGPAPTRENVYEPVYGLPVTPVRLSTRTDSDAQQLGLYLQDQLRLDRWVFLAGLREDRAESSTYNTSLVTGVRSATTEQSDRATTGRLGVVYLMDNGFAPYASYTTSFEPVVGADRQGAAFEPTEGRQKEIGIRWQPEEGRTMVTLSAYELTKRNVLTPDPVAPTLYQVQTGEIRSRGFEVEGKVELMAGLNLLASYSRSEVEITKDTVEAKVGKRPLAVPERLSSAWLDYNLAAHGLPGLTVGAGVRHVSSSYGDEYETLKVPSYTLYDAMARYDFDSDWSLTLNAKNLEDRQYAAACAYGTCWQGMGRSLQATLKYRW